MAGALIKWFGFLMLLDQFSWQYGGTYERYRRMWDVLVFFMAALSYYFWDLLRTGVDVTNF